MFLPDEEISKLYYSIREVAELLGEKPYVLRYWETEFDTLHPKKNRAGNRVYTSEDIDALRKVQSLLRDEKYTLEGARQCLLDMARSGQNEDGEAEFKSHLREIRVFLEKLLNSA